MFFICYIHHVEFEYQIAICSYYQIVQSDNTRIKQSQQLNTFSISPHGWKTASHRSCILSLAYISNIICIATLSCYMCLQSTVVLPALYLPFRIYSNAIHISWLIIFIFINNQIMIYIWRCVCLRGCELICCSCVIKS